MASRPFSFSGHRSPSEACQDRHHIRFREVDLEHMVGLQAVDVVLGLEAFLAAAGDVEHHHVVGFHRSLFDRLLQRGRGHGSGMIDVDALGLFKQGLGCIGFVVADGEDVAVLVDFGSLLGLETDGIGKGLVTGHPVRGDVHETHRLRGGDDGGDLVVHGQQFHLPDGLLRSQCKT